MRQFRSSAVQSSRLGATRPSAARMALPNAFGHRRRATIPVGGVRFLGTIALSQGESLLCCSRRSLAIGSGLEVRGIRRGGSGVRHGGWAGRDCAGWEGGSGRGSKIRGGALAAPRTTGSRDSGSREQGVDGGINPRREGRGVCTVVASGAGHSPVSIPCRKKKGALWLFSVFFLCTIRISNDQVKTPKEVRCCCQRGRRPAFPAVG